MLFYSRRIGLTDAGPAPIIGGARVLGRTGAWQVGALSMQTDDVTAIAEPSTNFSVLRVNRDVLSRSRVGFIGTSRAPRGGGSGNSYSAGADAQINFSSDLQLNSYWAKTQSDGRDGDDVSYRGRFDWNADRYAVNVEHLYVGENFAPEVGFMRRDAFRRSYALARFSPRPRDLFGVRKLYYQASSDYITGAAGGVQTQEYQGQFNVEFNNGDFLNAEATRAFEAIVTPFDIARGVKVPAGEYWFTQSRIGYQMGLQRRLSGSITAGRSSFYGGTLTEATWRGRVEFTPQFYAEPTLSWNKVDAPYGKGNANLASTRLTYTVTPRMFVAALLQYQSLTASMTSNLRFRWEYQPGSELFVVYSDGRTTLSPGYPGLESRSIVVKVTKLFRW